MAGWVGSSLGPYAPSTLGSFLRAFTFGHVRQLDEVASRFLLALDAVTPLVEKTRVVHVGDGFDFLGLAHPASSLAGPHRQEGAAPHPR